jgi:succinyl-CoA synthetase beta subunit
VLFWYKPLIEETLMKPDEIIAAAAGRGQRALSEYESKQVLQAYGIPVTREKLVDHRDAAVAAGHEIGYPLVLKACAADIMHKSEGGLVLVGLANEAALVEAYDKLAGRIKGTSARILVQEMIGGNRELVVGMTRDPQFGPCVMLGLGGIMTEILKDTVFRMAPVDAIEAADMADQLRSKKMLDNFRGQAPADRETLYRCLAGVGQIGLDHEAVQEIDVNPLVISSIGQIIAVDALIVLRS